MYHFIALQPDYLNETSFKGNEVSDEGKDRKETWTLKKEVKLGSCRKLALRASWTQSLIAQSIRASERNSVVVGSSATQVNFLKVLLQVLQSLIPYVSICSCTT